VTDPACAIAAMKDKIADFGGNPTDLQVLGHAKTAKRPDRSLDIAATVASAPSLIAAGVTDVRVTCSLPRDIGEATDLLTELVEAFRAVTS
jgi:tetrahydromethanopterin S-methyltransferase subunit H